MKKRYEPLLWWLCLIIATLLVGGMLVGLAPTALQAAQQAQRFSLVLWESPALGLDVKIIKDSADDRCYILFVTRMEWYVPPAMTIGANPVRCP